MIEKQIDRDIYIIFYIYRRDLNKKKIIFYT